MLPQLPAPTAIPRLHSPTPLGRCLCRLGDRLAARSRNPDAVALAHLLLASYVLIPCVALAAACRLTAAEAARACAGVRFVLSCGANALKVGVEGVGLLERQFAIMLLQLLDAVVQAILAILQLAVPHPGLPSTCAPPALLVVWLERAAAAFQVLEPAYGGPGGA